jgi:hypothetical protein
MRIRNELEVLAGAGQRLIADAESLVDAVEEGHILARILASDRPAVRAAGRRRPAFLLAGVAVLVAAAAVASLEISGGSRPTTKAGGLHGALSGAKIELAGYRFRTPAGFKPSTSSCAPASDETPVRNGFAAAASADGGCVEAAALIAANGSAIPADSRPVDVGAYQAWLVSQDTGESTLYVELPNATGDQRSAYLVLFARGLTQDQLIAVAESGLPTLPLRPTTTTPG